VLFLFSGGFRNPLKIWSFAFSTPIIQNFRKIYFAIRILRIPNFTEATWLTKTLAYFTLVFSNFISNYHDVFGTQFEMKKYKSYKNPRTQQNSIMVFKNKTPLYEKTQKHAEYRIGNHFYLAPILWFGI